jgi:hypothetical protein
MENIPPILVAFTFSGSTPFGLSSGSETRGKIGIIQFSAGAVSSATSKLSSSLDISCSSGAGNLTLTKLAQDPTNANRTWIAGSCQLPTSGTSTLSVGAANYPIGLLGPFPFGFILLVDMPTLTVVGIPSQYANTTIDSITTGTGTFNRAIFITGRVFTNTTIGGWSVKKLGTGLADTFVAKVNTSLIVSSMTNIYCTSTA